MKKKVNLSLEESDLKQLDELALVGKRTRSQQVNYLVSQEIKRQKRRK